MNFSNTSIERCIIHRVGNKANGGQITLSDEPLGITNEIEDELKDYFFKPFKAIGEVNQFHHEIDLKMNEIFVCTKRLFEDDDFIATSKNIASHLFSKTKHPSIKNGELFIVTFDEVLQDNQYYKGVGIFKAERKDIFFDYPLIEGGLKIDLREGTNKQKLDKGCIILEDDINRGYKIYSYEYNGADTEYWRNDFLSIIQKEDSYHSTHEFLSVCKDYVTREMPKNYDLSKADQIDLVNKSVEYFKNNEEFDNEDFKKSVFKDDSLIESFTSYTNEEFQDRTIALNNFSISQSAVNKQSKKFKSVLKLDKNFHVYIHGNRDLIEKGYDDSKEKSYYKIYFDEEI